MMMLTVVNLEVNSTNATPAYFIFELISVNSIIFEVNAR